METKKTLSIAEIHRLTGMKRYGTVFYMVHKIRVELGRLNKKEFLDKSSILPIDKKMKVEPVNLPEYLNIRYGKEVNHTLDKIYLIVPYNWKLNSSLEQLQKICCVGYRYKKVLKNSLSTFRGRQFERRKLEQKWSSNLSGNLIREIEGIYHNISPLHFQKVLDEYCFKYNYRHSRKGKFLSFFYLISGKG
ncbi:transposase [Lishizhenia tianjinensis]|uniref:transposase n=1 Tax=Lishizhenia tianjinensis TaxID=477690 RepID=UPI00111428CB|nr:transposase [Lishizhenia tianjinensis]